MLTSFFSKSRPINLIIVAFYLLVFFVIANFQQFTTASISEFFKEAGIFLLVVLSIIILNFISGKNELTGRNAFKLILFAGFISMFFAALRNDTVIISNLFVLLALRRVVSLKSQRETVQKIFDATLWIGIASLFYFWSILFLFLVYFGVLFHVGHRFKNWLVPPLALLALLSIVTSVDLLFTNTFYTFSEWFQESSFNFTAYRQFGVLLPVAFLFALILWSSFSYMAIIQKASANAKASLVLILLCAFVCITVAVLAPTKNSSELIFFFAPLAIIITNYLQNLEDKWFKEILLIVIVTLPVLLLLV